MVYEPLSNRCPTNFKSSIFIILSKTKKSFSPICCVIILVSVLHLPDNLLMTAYMCFPYDCLKTVCQLQLRLRLSPKLSLKFYLKLSQNCVQNHPRKLSTRSSLKLSTKLSQKVILHHFHCLCQSKWKTIDNDKTMQQNDGLKYEAAQLARSLKILTIIKPRTSSLCKEIYIK